MSEVTNHDVLDAADALLDRLDLIKQLNETLVGANEGDAAAMRKAADLFARTGRPETATYWRKKADNAAGPGSGRRVRPATSTS